MACTLISWISIVLNIGFLVLITWIMFEYLKLKRQVKRLANELGSDSLEHYLNEIKKRGFEFTLKPKDGKK